MNTALASKAYAKISVESGALGADPHKLIAMLYQGALLAIANARNSMMNKNTATKGAAISKALAIIDEGLNASLDKNAGGSLARNLSSLYDYMCTRLIAANLKNDMAALDEVARLLTDLKEAWENIRPNAAQAAPQLKQAAPQPMQAMPQIKQAMPQPKGIEGEFRGMPKPVSNTQLVYGRR